MRLPCPTLPPCDPSERPRPGHGRGAAHELATGKTAPHRGRHFLDGNSPRVDIATVDEALQLDVAAAIATPVQDSRFSSRSRR
jgi:hypothetical protein